MNRIVLQDKKKLSLGKGLKILPREQRGIGDKIGTVHKRERGQKGQGNWLAKRRLGEIRAKRREKPRTRRYWGMIL